MKKLPTLIILLFAALITAFPKNIAPDINTLLIIIEENENGEITAERPISDGLYNELWKKSDQIFFDIYISDHLNFVEDRLDIKPFLGVAEESGADSILLIKVDYASAKVREGLRLTADKFIYNLYSLKMLKSLKSGVKKVKLDRVIDESDKERTLNKFGTAILEELY